MDFVMKKRFLVFGALLALPFLSGCLCPPAGWEGSVPPWCGEVEKAGGPSITTTPSAPAEEFDYIKYGEGDEFFKKPVFFIDWVKDKTFYDKIPNVAINWRTEWFKNGKITKDTKKNIEWFHARNIHYIGYQHPATSQSDVEPVIDENFAAVDLSGKPIYWIKPGLGEEWTKGQYWANLLDPDWQEFLIAQGKMMIDAGVEGIIFDEPNFNRQIIFDRGGTFDEYSMNGFRDYLRSKYTKKELSEKFGINDIYNFNFRDNIINNGMENTWNKEPLPAITKEFANFQTLESSKIIRKIVNSLKEYGREKYNREILFSMNAGPEFIGHLMQTDFQNYGMGEHFYYTNGGAMQKSSVVVKLSEGLWNNKMVLLAEVSNDNGKIPNKNNKNLFKYIFADTYSSNGRLIVDGDRFMTLQNWSYVNFEDFVYYDVDEAAKYVNFAYQHPELYGLEEPAKVAVAHSIASRKGGAGLLEVEDRKVWSDNQVKAIIEMLLNLNVPFGTIISGDDELFNQRITKGNLQKYDVVILPTVFMIDQEEVNAVFDYAREGGKVIIINDFATHNKKGEKVQLDMPHLDTGENKIGDGVVYVLNEDLEHYFYNAAKGRPKLPTERSKDDTQLVKFRDVLYSYYSPEVITDAPITVNIRRYVDGDRTVLHLVNYDFDHIKDEFKLAGKFSVTVRLLEGSNPAKAILYDFEKATEEELSMTIANGKATISVPSLYAYSVIELE